MNNLLGGLPNGLFGKMNNQACKTCRYFIRRHLNLADSWGICDWPNKNIPNFSIPQFRYSWETAETYGLNCPSYISRTDLSKFPELQETGI